MSNRVSIEMTVGEAIVCLFGKDHPLEVLLKDAIGISVLKFASKPEMWAFHSTVSAERDAYRTLVNACREPGYNLGFSYPVLELPKPAETTVIIAKPDAMRTYQGLGLIGSLVHVHEMEVVGIQLGSFGSDIWALHYAEHKGKPFYDALINRMASGICVVAALRGPNAIGLTRAYVMMVRKKYGVVGNPENLLHASDTSEAANREVALWFPLLK